MITATLPRPGEQLPNGRTLAAIRKIRNARESEAGDLYAVLALTGNAGEYATWVLVWTPAREADLEPYCVQGYYTRDFQKAVADYYERGL